MHNPTFLSYAINLESVDLPTYSTQERIKSINNIGKIICQKGLEIISEVDPKLGTNIYGIISLQEITQSDWEILKEAIEKIEPGFLSNYDVFVSGNGVNGLVTLINNDVYRVKFSSITESLVSGINIPYHLFVLGDSSQHTNANINKVIYVNLELPKDKARQVESINTLKKKFDSFDKAEVSSYRVILTGHFNTETPELLPEFKKLLDGFNKNVLYKGPDVLSTSLQSNNPAGGFTRSFSHVFDNYNKFIIYSTLIDLTEFKENKILLSPHLPIFVKLGMVNVIEHDFAKVEGSFFKLVNVDFVISHISNLESYVVDFKKEISSFKSAYTFLPAEFSVKLAQMESKIEKNLEREKALQLFNEPHVFDNPIKEYPQTVFGSIITDLVVFGSKDSGSDSLVFKGKYNGNPVFIKMFSLDNSVLNKKNHGLTYEQKIYKYLMERSDLVKPYFQDYFVKVYDVFKVKYDKFFEQMESLGIKIQGGDDNGKLYYSSRYGRNAANNNMPQTFLGRDQIVYFTVTEDIQGSDFNSFISNKLDNEQIVIETLLEVIYGIYLLNIRLGITHGDNHFENILIKQVKSTPREYIIDKTTLIRKSNYRVCLYDFDLSFLFNYENKSLEEPFNQAIGRIGTQNYAKDMWTIINSIGVLLYDPDIVNNSSKKAWYNNMQNNFFGRIIKPGQYKKTYVFDLVHNVLTQTKEQQETLYENYQAFINSRGFWNTFCSLPLGTTCTQPQFPELHPELVLKRYIQFYKTELNFIEANAYYKKYFITNNLSKYTNKYLKYKKKYLELKNQIQLISY